LRSKAYKGCEARTLCERRAKQQRQRRCAVLRARCREGRWPQRP
jgi:hypothetical protein